MLGYVVGRATSNDPLAKVPFVKGYVSSSKSVNLERTHFVHQSVKGHS